MAGIQAAKNAEAAKSTGMIGGVLVGTAIGVSILLYIAYVVHAKKVEKMRKAKQAEMQEKFEEAERAELEEQKRLAAEEQVLFPTIEKSTFDEHGTFDVHAYISKVKKKTGEDTTTFDAVSPVAPVTPNNNEVTQLDVADAGNNADAWEWSSKEKLAPEASSRPV